MNNNKGKVGLINRGNTCFFNSSIQVLSNIPLLTNYIFNNEFETDISNRINSHKKGENDELSKEKQQAISKIIISTDYAKLIRALWTTEYTSLEPKSLHENLQRFEPSFSGFMQQDAQECLSFILDALHEGLYYETSIHASGEIENDMDKLMVESINKWSETVSKKYSIITDIFFGQFYIQTFSEETSYKYNEIISTKYEIFNILNIEITGNTIYDCLSNFFSAETIDGEYELDNKMKIKAKRKINIIKSPQVLIIVLKRFAGNNRFRKLNNTVIFPINTLDISSYCIGYDVSESIYKLKSAVLHSGSLNGGHYYSYVNHIDGEWYEYNDCTCEKIDIKDNREELFKNGYILIYEKK